MLLSAIALGAGAPAFLLARGCQSSPGRAPLKPDEAPGDSALPTPTAPPLPARFRAPAVEPTMRVRIKAIREASQAVVLGEEGAWVEIVTVPDAKPARPGGQSLTVVPAPLRVARGARGWSVSDGMNYQVVVPADAALVIRLSGPGPGDQRWRVPAASGVSIDGRAHPGFVMLVPRAAAPIDAEDPEPSTLVGFDVVNHVRIESYLPGVLAKELFSHWHGECFKAQAIAARTYAVVQHLRHVDRRHFDLSNNTASQVYEGLTTHRRAIDGARSTLGVVLLYDDLLLPAYYSSCCGGIAAHAADGISVDPGHEIAPLRGRAEADHWCRSAPTYEWRIRSSTAEIERRIVAWARARRNDRLALLNGLRALRVGDHNAFGRPRSFVLEDRVSGGVPIKAEDLRFACNFVPEGMRAPEKPLLSSFVLDNRLSDAGRSLEVTGRGHGHGVGLCQYGAQAMAADGRHFDEILTWYYPQALTRRTWA